MQFSRLLRGHAPRCIAGCGAAAMAGGGFWGLRDPWLALAEETGSQDSGSESLRPKPRPRRVINGSGVIGLTMTYSLRKATDKYDIHVVDKHDAVSRGCSFQNGGVINVEAIAPLNSYMNIFVTLRQAVAYAPTGAQTNTMVSYRAVLEPGLFKWLFFFLQNALGEPCSETRGR